MSTFSFFIDCLKLKLCVREIVGHKIGDIITEWGISIYHSIYIQYYIHLYFFLLNIVVMLSFSSINVNISFNVYIFDITLAVTWVVKPFPYFILINLPKLFVVMINQHLIFFFQLHFVDIIKNKIKSLIKIQEISINQHILARNSIFIK